MVNRTYEKGFKEESVKLASEIGVAKAAEDLGVPENTLYTWVSRAKKHGGLAFVGSGYIRQTPATAEMAKLLRENRELKRANEILKDALGFFAESRRK